MLSNLIVCTAKSCLLDFSFEPGHVTWSCDMYMWQSCDTVLQYRIIMWQIAFWLVHPFFTRKTSRHRNCADVLISHWPAGNRPSSFLRFWILKNILPNFNIFIKNKPFQQKSLNETLWKILWVTQTEQSGRQDSNSSRIKVHPYATIHIPFRSSNLFNRKNSVQFEDGRS